MTTSFLSMNRHTGTPDASGRTAELTAHCRMNPAFRTRAGSWSPCATSRLSSSLPVNLPTTRRLLWRGRQFCCAFLPSLRVLRVFLECGGKRSATPLCLAAERSEAPAKAPSPLRPSGALQKLPGLPVIAVCLALTAPALGQPGPTYRGQFVNHIVEVTWSGWCNDPVSGYVSNSYAQASLSIPLSRQGATWS